MRLSFSQKVASVKRRAMSSEFFTRIKKKKKKTTSVLFVAEALLQFVFPV